MSKITIEEDAEERVPEDLRILLEEVSKVFDIDIWISLPELEDEGGYGHMV